MPGTSEKRGEIHLGDLVRALKGLSVEDDEQARAVARALGFGLRGRSDGEATPRVYDPLRYATRKSPPRRSPAARPIVPQPPGPPLPVELPPERLDSRLEPLPPAAPPHGDEPPAWLNDDFRLLEQPEQQPLHRQSLFHDNTSRGVLAAALATRRGGGEVDLPALIDRIVSHEVIDELPTLPTATLERGCQLLLDYSDNMAPFWEDLGALAGQLRAILGENDLRVFEFDRNPCDAERWAPPDRTERWRPRKGRPVLVATDLGIVGRRRPPVVGEGWRRFIDRCQEAGCPLLILLPWQQRYWPRDLGRHPILLHWNPHTSAGLIRRRLGIGHEVGE